MTVSTDRKEYLALWRRQNQDRIREQARQWRQNNPEKCREQNAERQRKRREAEKAGIAPKKQSGYKYRRYEEGLITVAMVQAEDKPTQPDLFTHAPRPASGPRCAECGKRLYGYELDWGKCLRHKQAGIIQAREQKPSVTGIGG